MAGSAKKFILVGFIFILLIAIPASVYFLQKPQETQTEAAAETKLSFELKNPNESIKIGDNFDLDIKISPAGNKVSYAKIVITYDTAYLTAKELDIINDSTLGLALVGRDDLATSGFASIEIIVQGGKTINEIQKVARLTLKPIQSTGNSTTTVKINNIGTIIKGDLDSINTNALNAVGSEIKIKIDPASITPTSIPTSVFTPPSCFSLTTDRTPNGVSPFDITIGAVANKGTNNIVKATLYFGDTKYTDFESGTLGNDPYTARITTTHKYDNPGNFNISVIFTDSSGAKSNASDCTKIITAASNAGFIFPTSIATPTSINSATITMGPTNTATNSATITMGPTNTATNSATITMDPTNAATNSATINPSDTIIPTATIKPNGPGNGIIGIGLIGAMLSIIGGLIFFVL
ncbi:hypothetical protein LBMAG33_6180 [Candidatus Levyibacteriota bacterium]|nr:hypothetical protein LBMAG33_6180 [Candidatus Levybacteria bacterium]